MSRTKRDTLDTEAMFERLTRLLIQHAPPGTPMDGYGGTFRTDAEALRRISMTLHRWHEAECNGVVEVDENSGQAFGRSELGRHHRWPIPNREAGARKRLAAILKRYSSLTAYVQTDPRGCALYILKHGDVPEGEDVSSCYSNGLAVYR